MQTLNMSLLPPIALIVFKNVLLLLLFYFTLLTLRNHFPDLCNVTMPQSKFHLNAVILVIEIVCNATISLWASSSLQRTSSMQQELIVLEALRHFKGLHFFVNGVVHTTRMMSPIAPQTGLLLILCDSHKACFALIPCV